MPRCCWFKFFAINHSLFPLLYLFLSRVVLDCPVLAPEAWPAAKMVAAADCLPERARVLLDLVLERLHELRLVYILSLFAKINSISRQERPRHSKLEFDTALIKESIEDCALHIE